LLYDLKLAQYSLGKYKFSAYGCAVSYAKYIFDVVAIEYLSSIFLNRDSTVLSSLYPKASLFTFSNYLTTKARGSVKN
jgi:hypothetical protein